MARKPANKAPKAAKAPVAKAPPEPGSPFLRDVERLLELMGRHDLFEADISDGDRRIHLKRGAEPLTGGAAPQPPAAATPAAAPQPPPEEVETLLEIKSPMVGTFYTASSPDSDPYVTVGSEVDEDTVVCIVEAMKVMNEVRAECSGTIVAVCVQNTQPVEYGQPLFHVRPA